MRFRAVIFDLGGVVLGSPLHAIAAYEQELGIPSGFVNRVVAGTSPAGAWSRLERGELKMTAFYAEFEGDCRAAGHEIGARIMMERIGLFLCTGCDIGKAVNAEGFEELAEENGASTYTAHPCLCSPEGVTAIGKAVEEGAVDGLLIAACSERSKADVFRFDPTKVAAHRISLREHVAWSQKPGEEDTQMLAEDLLRMGLARVSKMELTKPLEETIDRTVLVHSSERVL